MEYIHGKKYTSFCIMTQVLPLSYKYNQIKTPIVTPVKRSGGATLKFHKKCLYAHKTIKILNDYFLHLNVNLDETFLKISKFLKDTGLLF